MTIKGFDASHYQGTINFSDIAKDNVGFAIFKATDGTNYVDPMFTKNIEGANQYKIPLIGAYHFARFTSEADAIKEAQFAVSKVKGKVDFLALDIEVGSGNLTADVIAFMNEVSKSGIPVEWYSYSAFIRAHFTVSELEKYPNWIADYSSSVDLAGASHWDSWQYSDKGSLNGINGNVDLDYMTDARFKALMDVKNPPVVKVESKPATDTSTPVRKSSPKAPVVHRTPRPSSPKYNVHTVRSGDSLSAISVKERVPLAILERFNNISNPNLIDIGQHIVIPREYKVKSGDCLSAIATHSSKTWQELEKINACNANLAIGEVLYI